MTALFNAIIRASIRHRHIVMVLAAVLVIAGVRSGLSAHLDALPSFTPPMVVVQAEAPGWGSSEVERRVTTPLEQALLGIPGTTRLRSTSSAGLCVLQITFEDGLDIFRARQLVSERLAVVRERLPAVLPAPQLAPISAPVGALIKLAYTVDGGSQETLRATARFAQWKLRARLEAIKGVSRVTVHGGAAARIEVRPDPEKMVARGVSINNLDEALESARSLTPLGRASVGSQTQPIRADDLWSLEKIDSIGQTLVSLRDGLPVRVEDVARVVLGAAPPVGKALYDGEPAIYIQVDKLPWADTLQVTGAVEAVLEDLDAEAPAGARRQPPVFRQADFIHTSLDAVGRAMALGAAFVIVVLIAFLRSPRLAAISLTALPLSIVAAVTVLLAGGVTINGMILGGLAIAVGEVVDDAIVDVENIWRRLRLNAREPSPRPALEVILDASTEVRGAVVYASLIVVSVLMPIMILGGVAGRIFSPLAETYALAVAASLLVALTVTPALSALLVPRLASSGVRDTWATRRLRRIYDRALARIERTPGPSLLLATVLGLSALVALPFLGGGFLPEFREGVLIAEVAAWPGTSLEETTRLAGRLTEKLLRDGGLPHVAVRVGRANLDEDAAPVYRMEMDLVLPAGAADPEDVATGIMGRMAAVPGLRFSVEGFLGERINEILSGERAPLAIKLQGNDLTELRTTATTMMDEIMHVPGIQAVRSSGLVDVPTTDIEIDTLGLAAAGLRGRDLVDSVAAWRQGIEVAQLTAGAGVSVPVVIAGPTLLQGMDRLPDLPVFTNASNVLPLSALARIREGTEPPVIQHEEGRRLMTVTARAPAGELSSAAAQIEQIASTMRIPPGVTWELAGQAAARRSAGTRLVFIACLVLGAIFIFLWMALGSVVDAAVVLAGLPLGMVGGVLAALVLPEGLSMAGLVGFVALSGVITRNGIMLVTHKNKLMAEKRGVTASQVILQAARERLLPIVMTASCAFLGLLPLAASFESAGSELESPMAIIVCAGLLTSTTLNLLAVPSFYLWRAQRGKRLEAGR